MWYLDEFINSNTDWKEKLEGAPYNLAIKEDGPYVLFKYSQIASDFSNPIVCQARGCIYKKTNDGKYKCVCRPYDKFFNYGEEYVARLDWDKDIRITEKIDGSLIKLWWDEGGWHWSTNGNIDAFKTPVSGVDNLTFGEIVRKALDLYKCSFFIYEIDKRKTHMFELTSPNTRVVIPYELNLYYLQSRDIKSGELSIDPFLNARFPTPKTFTSKDLNSVIAAANKLDWRHEGFVVSDGYNLVKCKSPAYLEAHYKYTRGCISFATLLEVALNNEDSEFLTYCPEQKERLDSLREKIKMTSIYATAAKTTVSEWFAYDRGTYARHITSLAPKVYLDFLFNCYSDHDLTWETYSSKLNWKRWRFILGEDC